MLGKQPTNSINLLVPSRCSLLPCAYVYWNLCVFPLPYSSKLARDGDLEASHAGSFFLCVSTILWVHIWTVLGALSSLHCPAWGSKYPPLLPSSFQRRCVSVLPMSVLLSLLGMFSCQYLQVQSLHSPQGSSQSCFLESLPHAQILPFLFAL